MPVQFTRQQQKVIEARNHNILVSAAAGSGKTAVLVERIIRMICDPEHPADIDRLLVVTFTRAAAAQMRERIRQAIAGRLAGDPMNAHLQRQETLLHRAQITTIDSFCSWLLRNYFSEIDLEPGWRVMEEAEEKMLLGDACKALLEERYASQEPAFLACVDYFCLGSGDAELTRMLTRLAGAAEGHPSPKHWLRDREADYDFADEEELLSQDWMRDMMLDIREKTAGAVSMYAEMLRIACAPDGPYVYADFLEQERDALEGLLIEIPEHPGRDTWDRLRALVSYEFARMPSVSRKDTSVDPAQKDRVNEIRKMVKETLKGIREQYFQEDLRTHLLRMQAASEPVRTLARLAADLVERASQARREKKALSYADLEHLALHILLDEQEDGTWTLRENASVFRDAFDEVMIDEYQDSNEVQELLLSAVSGELAREKDDPRYARFMVGDVKQSIYRFRGARPEIFIDKFETYHADSDVMQRIDLDRNFRSGREVLDSVNEIFLRIMRREIGGVEYDETVTLKSPENPAEDQESVSEKAENVQTGFTTVLPAAADYTAELLIADLGETQDSQQDDSDPAAMDAKRREALMIAHKIREMTGSLMLPDGTNEDGTAHRRPLQYKDIVILLRSTASWIDAFREVFESEGIPLYADYRAGYFSAQEIREVLQMLHVISNPRQDIPLYSVMHGYFGGFTEDEIARIRTFDREHLLFDAVRACADPSDAKEENGAPLGDGESDPALAEKCRVFLQDLRRWRKRSRCTPIHELISDLIYETGYMDYAAALPAGMQRCANLMSLMSKAASFEQTSYTGVFDFLRYIGQMHEYDVDYGEANVLDENGDAVRIMTIHKSKGLEFPVCFVAGLASRFAFKTMDVSSDLLYDADLGLGIPYVNTEYRAKVTTLRREAVADKIRRDALGEELRILYVAMTRAKNKLILTAAPKDLEKALANADIRAGKADIRAGNADIPVGKADIRAGKGAAVEPGMEELSTGNKHLPVSAIYAASCYFDLLLMAMAGQEEVRADSGEGRYACSVLTRVVKAQDLKLSELHDQFRMSSRKQALEQAAHCAGTGKTGQEQTAHCAGTGKTGQEQTSSAEDTLRETLMERFSARYPHENLQELYTKTSVSELKRAEHTLPGSILAAGEEPGESEAQLFAQEIPAPYLPKFLSAGTADEEAKAEQDTEEGSYVAGPGVAQAGQDTEGSYAAEPGGAKAGQDTEGNHAAGQGGAQYGTLVHRICQLLDYKRWKNMSEADENDVQDFLNELGASGKMDAALLSEVRTESLLPFIHSELAGRMAKADAQGLLRREQPFVLGVPANRLNPDFPQNETILIQGIIDAFFVEDGELVLVDYKTDRVRSPKPLIERYRVQLDYYADALQDMLHLPVKEKMIYSFALQKEILL